MSKFLAILLLLTFAACGQLNTTKKSKIPNWKTLNEKEFSIQYPPDWGLNQTGMMGTKFFLFSPADDKNDEFIENINFATQDLTGYELDLDAFVGLSEAQLAAPTMIRIKEVIIVESIRVKTAKPEFHKIIYSGGLENRQLVFEQYYWIIGQTAYVLTLTCEQDKFAAYKATGEKIMNSFVIKKRK